MRATWDVVDALDEHSAAEVAALCARIEQELGEDPLSEPAPGWLEHGARRHALRRHDARLTGYAVLAVGDEVDAEPAFGTFDLGLLELLEGLARPTSLLLRGVGELGDLEARGWRLRRELHRLRRPLPAEAPPPLPEGIVRRSFVPGRDEERWVAQNNAAFAGDTVQGTMTTALLANKERQGWFDPEGFVLFEERGELLASCWTKIRRTGASVLGEIYVISVAPQAQGRGLGRLAVLEGLASLYARGVTLAELYVRRDNVAAYALYEALGFHLDMKVVELRRG